MSLPCSKPFNGPQSHTEYMPEALLGPKGLPCGLWQLTSLIASLFPHLLQPQRPPGQSSDLLGLLPPGAPVLPSLSASPFFKSSLSCHLFWKTFSPPQTLLPSLALSIPLPCSFFFFFFLLHLPPSNRLCSLLKKALHGFLSVLFLWNLCG